MNLIRDSVATVISGSYRRHLGDMYELKSLLEARGVTVLSPVGSFAVNPGEEFIILNADPIEDHRILQDSVFIKIRRSSFLILYNKDDYIGRAALVEFGYAIATGIQILTLEPVSDPNLVPYTRLISDIFPNLGGG
jgi:hypothetical protein